MKKILLMKRYLNYMIFDILYILSIEISNNGSNHLRKFSFLRSMGCPVKIKEEYYKGTPFIIHPTCLYLSSSSLKINWWYCIASMVHNNCCPMQTVACAP